MFGKKFCSDHSCDLRNMKKDNFFNFRNTVNYRHFAHAHNNAHPPKIPKYRSKILYLTYGRYNAHPLKIQFLNLQAHGRYGGRLR